MLNVFKNGANLFMKLGPNFDPITISQKISISILHRPKILQLSLQNVEVKKSAMGSNLLLQVFLYQTDNIFHLLNANCSET